MQQQQAAGVELCCTQCYGIGGESRTLQRISMEMAAFSIEKQYQKSALLVAAWFDEYSAAVGRPLELPVLADAPAAISRREYSGATVLVNAYNNGTEGSLC